MCLTSYTPKKFTFTELDLSKWNYPYDYSESLTFLRGLNETFYTPHNPPLIHVKNSLRASSDTGDFEFLMSEEISYFGGNIGKGDRSLVV